MDETQNLYVKRYCEEFAVLAPNEKWKEIEIKGLAVLRILKTEYSPHISARICVAAFFLKKYDVARKYANHCHTIISIIQDEQTRNPQFQLAPQNKNISELAKHVQIVFAACDEMQSNTRQ